MMMLNEKLDILETLVEKNKIYQPTVKKNFNYDYTDSYKKLMFNCHTENKSIDSDVIINYEKDDNISFEYITPINKYIINQEHSNECLVYEKTDIPDYKINLIGNGCYTLYEKPLYTTVDGINLYFINIPKEIYLQSGYTHQHLNYNSDKKEFFAYRKSLKEVNEYVHNVYENGLQSPILMQVHDGNIYPLCMRIKYFSAYYLELPSIPVCIVDGFESFVIGKLEGNQNKEKLQELLYPYIIV